MKTITIIALSILLSINIALAQSSIFEKADRIQKFYDDSLSPKYQFVDYLGKAKNKIKAYQSMKRFSVKELSAGDYTLRAIVQSCADISKMGQSVLALSLPKTIEMSYTKKGLKGFYNEKFNISMNDLCVNLEIFYNGEEFKNDFDFWIWMLVFVNKKQDAGTLLYDVNMTDLILTSLLNDRRSHLRPQDVLYLVNKGHWSDVNTTVLTALIELDEDKMESIKSEFYPIYQTSVIYKLMNNLLPPEEKSKINTLYNQIIPKR